MAPKRATSLKRVAVHWQHSREIPHGRPSATYARLECSFDAADVHLQMNKPISFKAEAGESYFNPNEAILKANNIDPSYGLGWIPDKQVHGRVDVRPRSVSLAIHGIRPRPIESWTTTRITRNTQRRQGGHTALCSVSEGCGLHRPRGRGKSLL